MTWSIQSLLLTLAIATQGQAAAAPLPRVVLETEAGEIEIEVDTQRAPVTGENFLKYVDLQLYDGGRFHRTVRTAPDNQPNNTVKIEVIQGAADTVRRKEFLTAVPLERTSTTKLSHVAGAVSMARSAPDSARDEFFICLRDEPELDFGGKRNPDGQGFAVFGRVVRGMDAVRRIHESRAEAQQLTPAIRIEKVRRKK